MRVCVHVCMYVCLLVCLALAYMVYEFHLDKSRRLLCFQYPNQNTMSDASFKFKIFNFKKEKEKNRRTRNRIDHIFYL